MSFDFANSPLMKMQQRMLEIQRELQEMKVEGAAADGKVQVCFNGKSQFEFVKIAPELVKRENKEMLEKAIVEAARQAVTRLAAEAREKTESARQQLGLPKPPEI
jgi:DNA-binding YbaB/EbfC family protein